MNTTATETALLISMYETSHPRTVALAKQGHVAAIQALECTALGDEVQGQVDVACMKLRDRGISWGAIYVTACSCARLAKSRRARVILHRMASTAEKALPANW